MTAFLQFSLCFRIRTNCAKIILEDLGYSFGKKITEVVISECAAGSELNAVASLLEGKVIEKLRISASYLSEAIS